MPGAQPILLVGDYPPPHGGVAVHIATLRAAIRAAGRECAVLDIGKGQVPADGVHPAGGYASFAAQLASFAARGFALHVHTSGANAKSWLLAAGCAAVARASGRPSFITLHSGLGPEWLAASAARRLIAAGTLRAFDTVVAVSEQIASVARGLGVQGERLLTLPAFSAASVEPGDLPAAASALRKEARPMLCAMLAPGPVYGEDLLIDAFALVRAERPGARLAVFGPGTASRSIGALDGVLGLGELARPAALAVMAAADLFVRPTRADGDSVSVREALALGKPVVASDVGTRPPGVRLVPAGDAAALARGILAALDALERGPTSIDDSARSDFYAPLLQRYGPAAPAASPRARAA